MPDASCVFFPPQSHICREATGYVTDDCSYSRSGDQSGTIQISLIHIINIYPSFIKPFAFKLTPNAPKDLMFFYFKKKKKKI